MLSRKPRLSADLAPVTIEATPNDTADQADNQPLDGLIAALDRAVLRLSRSTQNGSR